MATGTILSGDFGAKTKEQETIMGEAVNNAVRICRFARMGQILVDENAQKAVNESYKFQALEPIPLEGIDETLGIFELTGKKRKKIKPEEFSERKITSEMVGRSREMEQLESLFHQLLAGKGSIVSIVGKAGIGKSRLMAEIKAQPIMEKMLLLEGRAIATGKQLSFHPIANLIRNWAGILDDDLPSVSATKLQQSVQKIAPEQADEIFVFTAKMMGLPLKGKHQERVKGIEGEALEKLIMKNLRDLIINATKAKPRIYVIEDMHWSDQSSLNLFKSLYKLSLTQPVMFINVLRPGYADTGDYILKYLKETFPENHTTIHLDPLDRADADKLITNLLRKAKLPKETEEMIIRKTEGNPFFIEEVLRSFIDDGIIEVKEGHFRVTEKIKEANIPDTINDAILSRVDKLDEKTRELLNTASVMGRNFYYKVLEEATDTIEELDERLSYLSEVQLITETKKKEEIEYLFKHALAQQLTYDAMMQQSRKDTHLKIAHSIEKVFAANINEFYGTLAYHYENAENKEKSLQYLILAGDESANSGASAEALNFYKKAFDLLPLHKKRDSSNKEVRDLEIKIALGYQATGKNLEAVESFETLMQNQFGFKFPKTEKAIELRGIISVILLTFMINNQWLFFKKKLFKEFDLFAKIANYWGFALLHLNPKHWALKVATVEVFIARYEIHHSYSALNVLVYGATIFNLGGVSIKTAKKIIDFVQKIGDEINPISLVDFTTSKKVHDYFIAHWEIDKDFDHIYNKGLRTGGSWATSSYVYYSGMCSIELGNHSRFLEMAEKMTELAEAFDYSYTRTLRMRLLVMGFAKFRQYDKILATVDDDIAFIKTTGNEAMLLNVLFYKAQACTFSGMLKDAQAAIDESEDIIDNHKRIPLYFTQYLITKIKLGIESIKNLEHNEPDFQSGTKELQKLSNKLLKLTPKNIATFTEAYLLKAKILFLQKKFSKAYKNLDFSIVAGEKYNSRPDLSRAYFETGKFLCDPKTKQKQLNGLSGKDYLEKAKTMFEEMDLQWDLEEYRKFVDKS